MERLFHFLNALGRDVQITVKAKPRSRPRDFFEGVIPQFLNPYSGCPLSPQSYSPIPQFAIPQFLHLFAVSIAVSIAASIAASGCRLAKQNHCTVQY
jgi:hypothetical protein